MANVFAWPPVGAVGAEWTEIAPLDESYSGVTGKRYASSNQPVRRVASAVVSSLARDRNGAGYMSILKRLLVGGQNYVRLYSYPINWHLDASRESGYRALVPLEWTAGGAHLVWLSGSSDLVWTTGATITATALNVSGAYPVITVTGLPPSILVARPGEFLTVFANPDDLTGGSTVQVLAPAYSNDAGVAFIKLFSAPSIATGRVNIGQSDTAVFRVVGDLPRSQQPVGADWSYAWQLQEVFADEVGGFVEDADWWRST